MAKKECKNCFEGKCTNPPCNYLHPPVCQNYKSESGCKFSDKCLFRHTEAHRQPSKMKEKCGKGSVALLKESIQLGCVFQDKGPSQGVFQKCEPQERNPCAPKFEDGTQEETLQQARCARRKAWDLAKNVCNLKAKDKATFYSLTEAWVMPAPSSKKPEEREKLW